MECPRCKLTLIRDRYEGVEVDLCQGCWGVWLDTGELETVLESRQFQFSPDEQRVIQEGRAQRMEAPSRPVACPKCSARMERIYLDPKIYLVIDRCPRHGIWLDTGEIKLLQAMAEASQAVSRLLVQKIKGLPPRKA